MSTSTQRGAPFSVTSRAHYSVIEDQSTGWFNESDGVWVLYISGTEAARYTSTGLVNAGLIDLNGLADGLVLDADGDTTVSAPTDDQIDVEVGGIDLVKLSNTAQNGLNGLSDRFELKWVAGQRGKPSLNADFSSATEATSVIADPDFEILGTNASSDDTTFNAEGGIKMQTDGADGDGVILLPHLDANLSAWKQVTWGTDKSVIWECRIATGANDTNAIIWAGLKLTNTDVIATDDDQVFFRYEDDVSAGVWTIGSSIADTDTTTVTTNTVAVSTEYHLKIIIASDRTAKCYINGTLELTTTALTDAVDLIPYIGVEADGAAAAKDITVYGQAISRAIG